jgi:hypothetical protein
MKTRGILSGLSVLLLTCLLPGSLFSQRGDIVISTGAVITVPLNAQICADRIFANNPGYGTLTLADASGICSGAVITPVELLMFSCAHRDGVVALSWITATETRCYGFEVQRKTDDSRWFALGFVAGHGTTTQQHDYGFTDPLGDLSAYCCLLDYRLKLIDLDGRFEYSPEVEVRLDAPLPGFSLRAHPSPCNELLTVQLGLAESGATSIFLHDIAGRTVVVIAQNTDLRAGNYSFPIRTSGLSPGLYLLTAETRDGRRMEKVMVRH